MWQVDVSVIFLPLQQNKAPMLLRSYRCYLNILAICKCAASNSAGINSLAYLLWKQRENKSVCTVRHGCAFLGNWRECRKELLLLPQLPLALEGWLEHSSIPHVHFSFSREKLFCSFIWSFALPLGFPSYLFQISLTTKFTSPILTFIFRCIFSHLILVFIHYFEASLVT